MDGNGEDRISNLPESVVCHILSRLPTEDAVRTSFLSKDWEHKFTSICNIELDDNINRNKSMSRKMKSESFASLVERTLHLTQNSRIKSFRLTCHRAVCPVRLERWLLADVFRGVQSLEINIRRCREYTTLVNPFEEWRSLTELKLFFNCVLSIYPVMNCFSNLKILYLNHQVELFNYDSCLHSVLNFPVLEELELRCCQWVRVLTVEINAPMLKRFFVEGQRGDLPKVYVIKIDGIMLEKFEICGGVLDNYVVSAPSVFNAVLTCCKGGDTFGSRAREILNGFPALEYLKLSGEIVEALAEFNANFSLPCFNRLKQLEICNHMSNVALLKLLQVMPSLESISLDVYYNEEGLESFPSGIASRLKVIKLVRFRGTSAQIHLAQSLLNNVENLETLFVSIFYKPLRSKIEIRNQLSTFHRSSTRATIVVNGPRKGDTYTWTGTDA